MLVQVDLAPDPAGLLLGTPDALQILSSSCRLLLLAVAIHYNGALDGGPAWWTGLGLGQ